MECKTSSWRNLFNDVNDVVAYEDVQIRNVVKTHQVAKSIVDAAWYQFRQWLDYFGTVFGVVTVAVPSQYSSQTCSCCGHLVKMSLSTRPHLCQCGTVPDRDSNAAINIFLETEVEHVTSLKQEPSSATMESSSFAALRTGRMSNP
ncbi:RNA-guided endonuclease InsQ/TnpB family protein [Parathermosynechococcus lividus]